MTLYSNVFMSWRWKSVLAAKCSGELESSQYMCVDTIEKPAFLTQWWIYIESKYITVFFGETLPFVEKGSIKEKWPYYVDPWLLFLENWPFTQSWKSVLDPIHLMEKSREPFQVLSKSCENETSVVNQWVKEFYEQIPWRIERQSSWEGPAFSKGEDNLWCERYGGNKKAVFLLVQPQMGRKWLSLSSAEPEYTPLCRKM